MDEKKVAKKMWREAALALLTSGERADVFCRQLQGRALRRDDQSVVSLACDSFAAYDTRAIEDMWLAYFSHEQHTCGARLRRAVEDGLRFNKFKQTFDAAFATEAGLFHAAERRFGCGASAGVVADVAEPQAADDALGALRVGVNMIGAAVGHSMILRRMI